MIANWAMTRQSDWRLRAGASGLGFRVQGFRLGFRIWGGALAGSGIRFGLRVRLGGLGDFFFVVVLGWGRGEVTVGV